MGVGSPIGEECGETPVAGHGEAKSSLPLSSSLSRVLVFEYDASLAQMVAASWGSFLCSLSLWVSPCPSTHLRWGRFPSSLHQNGDTVESCFLELSAVFFAL